MKRESDSSGADEEVLPCIGDYISLNQLFSSLGFNLAIEKNLPMLDSDLCFKPILDKIGKL